MLSNKSSKLSAVPNLEVAQTGYSRMLIHILSITMFNHGNSCQDVQSHHWACSYGRVSPPLSSWGTNSLLVPPPPCPLQTRDHILCICSRAVWEEDRKPPFSQIEVLEFCSLNMWVFDFPPQKGGSLTEQVARCYLLVGGGVEVPWQWAGCQLGVMVLTDLYGELMLSGESQETLMDGGQSCCWGALPSLTSTPVEVHGELTSSNVGCVTPSCPPYWPPS